MMLASTSLFLLFCLLLFVVNYSALLVLAVSAADYGVQQQQQKQQQEKPPINVIVIGGSSGMGKAAALEVIKHGGRVMLVSRTKTKLEQAKQQLLNQVPSGQIEIFVLDVTQEQDVKDFAAQKCKLSLSHAAAGDGDTSSSSSLWDGLVITAAGRAAHGPLETLPTNEAREMLESKLWGAHNCAKYIGPHIKPGGSIVFCAGILNRRPGLNCSPLAMANGALEGLTRSLALEWGPPPRQLRVNCLSPGFCNTERFDHMTDDKKQLMFENTASSLPLRRIGQPSDMGQAIYYLLTAPFCTGVILDVDGKFASLRNTPLYLLVCCQPRLTHVVFNSKQPHASIMLGGHGIRQYANANNDPMRQTKKS